MLFTTNNLKISLAVWIRKVLKGNYQKYLEETAAAYHQKCWLEIMVAPALIRFREFYGDIIRYKTYRKKVGYYFLIFRADETLRKEKASQNTFDEIYSEIDWLEKEYFSFMSESYGRFTWKKTPEHDTPRPFFRLESESKIK
jgi:hypothetical protein